MTIIQALKVLKDCVVEAWGDVDETEEAPKSDPTFEASKEPAHRIDEYLCAAGWKKTASGWWYIDPRDRHHHLPPLEAFGIQVARDSCALFR